MRGLSLFLTIVAISHAAVPKYRSFENMDVNLYKNDKSALDELYQCLIGTGEVCLANEANLKARGQKIVTTLCEDCRPKEKQIVRDMISLIGNDDPYHLHNVLDAFDPESQNDKSFLLSLRPIASLSKIPFLNSEVIDEFRDRDEVADAFEQFTDEGGLLGAVGDLVRDLVNGVLDGVGI